MRDLRRSLVKKQVDSLLITSWLQNSVQGHKDKENLSKEGVVYEKWKKGHVALRTSGFCEN